MGSNDCGIARMMTERVVEVNRALSANQIFFTKTWGVAPGLQVSAAPLALELGLSQSARKIEKQIRVDSRPVRRSPGEGGSPPPFSSPIYESPIVGHGAE